jgi:hypothetical protein
VSPADGTPADASHSADEALVARLIDVIGGRVPMSEAEHLLAPDVVSHMDGYTVRGTAVWIDWLAFLLSKAKGSVTVEVDRMVTGRDGRITVFGWLQAPHTADSARRQHRATYRVENGRIAEIWTTRGNYEMIFGPKVRHPVRWLFVLVEMAVWRRLPWRSRPLIPHPRRGDAV